MKKQGINAFSLAVPWRQITGRLAALLLLTLSFALILLSKTDSALVHSLRAGVASVAVPALDVAARPLDAAGDFGGWVGEIANIRSENVRLKAENAELARWQLVARQMEAENRSLHSLMRFTGERGMSYTTTRIVTDATGPYLRSGLLAAGSGDGVEKNEAVVSDRGLIGRIAETGPNHSRVLLITDINSRIPVIGELTREKSVLAGTNADLPQLNYLADNSKISPGERIVTAGDGKLIPPGLPVGIVTKVKGGIVQVQPHADWSRLEYVSVVHQ